MHVYVPIVRGPVQKAVWTFAKALAVELAARIPALMTSEYRVAKRPRGRVLVDYNQNAWGQHAGQHLLGAADSRWRRCRRRSTWDEVAAGVTHRGLPPGQRARADREGRRSLEAAARRARTDRPDKFELQAAHARNARPTQSITSQPATRRAARRSA